MKTSLAELGTTGLRLMGAMVASAVGLAINAAGASTIRTGVAINYSVNGLAKVKAALTAQALTILAGPDFVNPASDAAVNWLQPAGANVFYVQPAGKTVYYVLAVNEAGLVRVVQGLYDGQRPTNHLGLTMAGRSRIPFTPEGWVPFGFIKITTNSSTTFGPGVTALDAAGLTVSFNDVTVLPADSAP